MTAPATTTQQTTGLRLDATGTSTRGTCRVVHAASGMHLPMVSWPTDDLPRRSAEIAQAILEQSGVDWTRPAAELRADLGGHVTRAMRDAAVIARAVHRRAGRRSAAWTGALAAAAR